MAGRPREFDRDVALRKARDAFWARGYEGVSMSDLVRLLGLASARIYAAFGSKDALFREAIGLYEASEGGFATRALAEETTASGAMRRILLEAVETYTSSHHPPGCMVVTAATNCSADNESVRQWLIELRRQRTNSLTRRFEKAVLDGELADGSDTQALGDHFATVLHGLSVQARDGVPRERLLAVIPSALKAIQLRGEEALP